MCKMVRGEMVRFMAENGIRNSDQIKDFDRLGCRFCPQESDDERYVFIKSKAESTEV